MIRDVDDAIPDVTLADCALLAGAEDVPLLTSTSLLLLAAPEELETNGSVTTGEHAPRVATARIESFMPHPNECEG